MVSAARISATNCASTSKSTVISSSWPRCVRWPTRARSPSPRSPRPSRNTASIRKKPTRTTLEGKTDMSKLVEIKVPDIGDFKEVEVIEVLVAAGDTIKAEQSLITVESDKASMEIPASAAGLVKSVKVKVGDKIAEGAVILEIEAGEAEAKVEPAPAAAAAPAAAPAPEAPAAQAAPAAQPQQGGGRVEIAVPDIGDFKEVEVIEVL